MSELSNRNTDASDARGSSTRRARVVAIAVCAVLALGGTAAIGCGGDDEESTTTAAESTSTMAEENTTAAAQETTAEEPAGGGAAADTDAIGISDFKYDPEIVTVEAGTEVTWTNSDEAPHTATADDSSFDTGTLDLDDEGTATFDEPGTYSYYCRFHAFMKATVEVE